jgi:hypothetical protein
MDTMDSVSNCEKCGDKPYKWCRPCQMNDLKKIHQTSGNEKIDSLIQKMHFKISYYYDIVFEWIPYNQLIDVKEININIAKIYTAIWKDGPLNYNTKKIKYERSPNKKVALKWSCNSHANEFLNNEV